MVSVNLSLDAENAVQMTAEVLDKHQLRAVRNFDLRNALSTQDIPCPCPHHGTATCDCNYVVLSVYAGNACPEQRALLAGQILIHTHAGDTWLSLPTDTVGQAVAHDADIDRRLLRALAEVVARANAIGVRNGA